MKTESKVFVVSLDWRQLFWFRPLCFCHICACSHEKTQTSERNGE